jgi:hypothetical protein
MKWQRKDATIAESFGFFFPSCRMQHESKSEGKYLQQHSKGSSVWNLPQCQNISQRSEIIFFTKFILIS